MKISKFVFIISILVIGGFFMVISNIGVLKAQISEVISTVSSSSITTNQILVNNAAGGTLIRVPNVSRRSIIIRNQDTQVDMYVGNQGLTIATGLLVRATESLTLDRTTAAIYGITNQAANITVGYLEE